MKHVAIFDAFLAIYKCRIAGLLRIATNGTGMLPAGDLHPDLVRLLAAQAAKAAKHGARIALRPAKRPPRTGGTAAQAQSGLNFYRLSAPQAPVKKGSP